GSPRSLPKRRRSSIRMSETITAARIGRDSWANGPVAGDVGAGWYTEKMPFTVLPDAARVEAHVVRRASPFATGPLACTFGELERDVVRAARASGACGR